MKIARLDENGIWICDEGGLVDGEPVTVKVWRGYGRADSKAIYKDWTGGVPILGTNTDIYYAGTKEQASEFGPQLEQVTATLQSPVYLDSREKIYELFGYLPDGSENKTAYPELREKLVKAGHDGLIVSAPHNEKLVRNAFGVSQLIVFGKQST